MIQSIDLLYIALSVAVIIVTILLVSIGIHVMLVLQDVRRITGTLEGISELLGKIAAVVLPGVERAAHRIDGLEQKIGKAVERTIESVISSRK